MVRLIHAHAVVDYNIKAAQIKAIIAPYVAQAPPDFVLRSLATATITNILGSPEEEVNKLYVVAELLSAQGHLVNIEWQTLEEAKKLYCDIEKAKHKEFIKNAEPDIKSNPFNKNDVDVSFLDAIKSEDGQTPTFFRSWTFVSSVVRLQQAAGLLPTVSKSDAAHNSTTGVQMHTVHLSPDSQPAAVSLRGAVLI